MQFEHKTVIAEKSHFFGWPANNGLWAWEGGSEILVGCVAGEYDPTAEFHAVQPPYRNYLLRSRDGGETWRAEIPHNFAGQGLSSQPLQRQVNFTHPGFAMRVAGDGYHGSSEPNGAFFNSYDRGVNWQGPFRLHGLEKEPVLAGMRLTPRTDYIVEGPHACLLMLSARPDSQFTDRVFCVRTVDGGRSFGFIGWMVSPEDPYRAAMPASLACGAGLLVSAVRRRAYPEDINWIDAYISQDNGRRWDHLAKVGDTGGANGNPPALARLADGRLCCVYGRRDTLQLAARFSRDDGLTWESEVILREDFHGERPDFGYPRLVQRPDGRLVCVYYWATRAIPQQHIAATIWTL
jgi:hypothetical protein